MNGYVLELTIQCVHASAVIDACNSVLDEPPVFEPEALAARVIAAATKVDAERLLGRASMCLSALGANVLDACRAIIAERGR